jgi:hypothetical protein
MEVSKLVMAEPDDVSKFERDLPGCFKVFEQEPDATCHLLFAQLPAGVSSDGILLAAHWDF